MGDQASDLAAAARSAFQTAQSVLFVAVSRCSINQNRHSTQTITARIAAARATVASFHA